MCVEYDESLIDNPFFNNIQENYKNVVQKATTEGWIICIPRKDTIHNLNFEDDDVFHHVLVPHPRTQSLCYKTLTNKTIQVLNKTILLSEDAVKNEKVKILFEEVFYVNQQKYTVWCIANPLNVPECSFPIEDFKKCNDLQDCVNLLNRYSLINDILKFIEFECSKVLEVHKHLETECLENIQNIVKELFLTLLNKILIYVNIDKLKRKAFALENFKLSVETYMHFVIHKWCFPAICNATSHMDSSFNKIVRNNSQLECKDLMIDTNLHDFVAFAKLKLNQINSFSTILDKINCLKSTFQNYRYQKTDNSKLFSADDFLNITIFIIYKSNVYNWIANITYITQFICNDYHWLSENSFFVTTLEASIQYIQKKGIFFEMLQEIYSENDHSENLNLLVDTIREGSYEKFNNLFSTFTKSKTPANHELCHPLCSCDSCENKIKHKINVNTVNENGWTLLHFASYYGRLQIVEQLIHQGANVCQLDFMNNSPIHYASSRGHQDVLLLLLHAGNKINLKNYNGNTSLHLASYNGHENCVKALVYSKLSGEEINVNIQNNCGDTALHLASKLGFFEIVSILLQYGANPYLENKKKVTAIDSAHNYYIKQMILLTKRYEIVSINKNIDNIIEKECENNLLVSQKNYTQIKKIEQALKAIENNDTPLMCYYLEIPLFQTKTIEKSQKAKCHPLCTCEKCQENNHKETLNFVLPVSRSMYINNCNSDGYTPLHIAAKYGRSEIIRLLLDNGGLVNAKSFAHQYVPLHLACLYQRIGCVKELIKSGACNIDAQDTKGNTPLHYAVIVNNIKIVETLLEAGGNYSLKNNKENTPEMEAENRTLLTVSKLFLNKYNKSIS